MSDEAVSQPSSGGETRDRVARQRDAGRPSGFGLRIYKPGQGYYTRMGTAIGIGILSVTGASFLLEQLGNLDLDQTYLLPVQYGVAFGFIVLMALVVYWIAGLGRSTNDFFIATEGEIKKVRWSTRKEVTRSTKVVIVTVVLMGTFLFVADILFMLFFSTIKVLKASPGLDRLFVSGS